MSSTNKTNYSYTKSEIDSMGGGTSLSDTISQKANINHNHDSTYLGISAKAESAKSADSVAWNNVSGKPSSYTPSSHTHDDRYYTESEIDTKLSSKANASDVVKTSGGSVMTGSLGKTTTSSNFVISGGTDWQSGAFLNLYGKDNSAAGDFVLEARNSTGNIGLRGSVNGALTWGGKSVDIVDSYSFATGQHKQTYIRYSNGIQICSGVTNNLSNISTGITQVTFIKPFTGYAPSVITEMLHPTTDYYSCHACTVGNGSFTVYGYLRSGSDSFTSDAFMFNWIAIGRWK